MRLTGSHGMKAQQILWKNRLSSGRKTTIGRPLVLTLYSYPELFGVADNNPYGLKIFAFLKLCNLPFRHEHILDAKNAPRGQLPYIVDGDAHIGDSDAIVAHLIRTYGLEIDSGLTPAQRDTHLMIRRMLDDLYWVMSY